MANAQTVAVLRQVVSSHINSIADAFFSLGGERSPDFVLGLTTLDEALAFSSPSSSRQWITYLRSHKLVSSEGAPHFKFFEHNLARPSDVFQFTSITPALSARILLRACGGNAIEPVDGVAATPNFDAACAMAMSQSSLDTNDAHQPRNMSLAQVNACMVACLRLSFSWCEQFAAALCALASRCIRSVTEFGMASACSSQAALLALLQHLQIVDNMCVRHSLTSPCFQAHLPQVNMAPPQQRALHPLRHPNGAVPDFSGTIFGQAWCRRERYKHGVQHQ